MTKKRTSTHLTALALLQPSSGEQIITLNTTHFDRTRDTNSYELSNTHLRFVYDFHVQSYTFERKKKITVINYFNTNSKAVYYQSVTSTKIHFLLFLFFLFSRQASIHNSRRHLQREVR